MNRISLILLAGTMITLAGSHQARGDDGAVTGQYWFDNSTTTTSFTPGHLEIPVVNLTNGLHTFNAFVQKNGVLSSTQSQWFIKTNVFNPGDKYTANLLIDGNTFGDYQCPVSADGLISLSLDVNSLPLGVHSIKAQVIYPDGSLSGYMESMFLRVPTTEQISTMKGFYMLDGSRQGNVTPAFDGSTFHLDIDASQLSSGIHSVSVFLASPLGMATTVHNAWFFKIPAGGEGVKTYEYWLNDNFTNRQKVTLEAVANPLQLINLIDVQESPFRSSSYSFAIEDGEPVIYPVNKFNIIFFDPDNRMTLGASTFADVRGRSVVSDIELLENTVNTSNSLPLSIAENQIKWYSFIGEIGDSVAMHLSKGGMMELYGPEGVKIFAKSGADAVGLSSATLTDNGTYYVAVHDLNKDANKPTLGFDHISRHAICSFTPEEMGVNPMMIVNFVGNGLEHAKEISLEGINGTYSPNEIQIQDNYRGSIFFSDEENAIPEGEYNLKCVFVDPESGETETVISKSTLQVVKPVPGEINVEIVDSHIISTPYMASVKVTNTGNVPYYCVPFNVAMPDVTDDATVQFSGFFEPENDSDVSIFNTCDNIAGTGMSGALIRAIIPCIAPGETLTFDVGFITGPHEKVRWYAWCGTPWSEEIKEMESEDYDDNQILTPSNSGFFTIRDLAYLIYTYDQPESEQQNGMKKFVRAMRASVQAAGQAAKPAVDAAARGSMNAISTRRQGYSMLRQMCGDYDFLDQMDRVDRGMLGVGEELIAAANTRNNFLGNVQALFHLFQAAQRWHEAVTPNLDNYGNDGGGGSTSGCHVTDCYQSGDPNDMYGYTSPSGDNYIGLDVKEVSYTIEFENDPEIANASAARIKVDDSLDGKVFDLTTFKPLKMIIGKKETELPASHSFVQTLDMRPEINAIAELSFNYDADKGEASWSIRSLDPMTLEPTRYIDDGILPVNDDSGHGTGFLTYSIGLLDGLADGTKIKNSAVIVFDDNEPISTPEYVNVTDYILPEAMIVSKQSEDDLTFSFNVNGTDTGSGVWYYNLYVRPSGSKTWTLVRHMIEEDEFGYTASSVLEGADFAVVAVDRAGNSQKAGFLTALTGDADDNGVINASDVVITVNYYMDSSVKLNRDNADVNLDGVINAQDATIISNLYLGDGPFKARSRKYPKKK